MIDMPYYVFLFAGKFVLYCSLYFILYIFLLGMILILKPTYCNKTLKIFKCWIIYIFLINIESYFRIHLNLIQFFTFINSQYLLTLYYNVTLMKTVNKPVYIAASLLAILSVVAVSSSGNFNVFAQGTDFPITIVPGGSTLTEKAYNPPAPQEVKVGQKVIWTNDDSVQHTITSGTTGSPDSGKEFDSGLTKLLSKGDTFEHTFAAAGEFPYYCQLHPQMSGTIVVK
jgi:plastocyanin